MTNIKLIRDFYYKIDLLIKNRIRANITEGVVKGDVNLTTLTCTVTINKVDFENIPFAVLNNEKCDLLEVPAVGSDCIVYFKNMNEQRAMILKCNKLDKVIFFSGTNGAIDINNLITKINRLESSINTLKTNFSSWVVVPNDGGAALKTITATWAGSQITNTVKSDIEIIKILQS